MEINFIVRGNIPLTISLSAADKKNLSYAIILQMRIASSKSLFPRAFMSHYSTDLEYNPLNGFHWNYAKFLFGEIIWV